MTRENTAKSMRVGLNAEAMPLTPELAVMMKEEVDRIRKEKLPVNRAFEVIAKKSGLKYNTVRNYYYRYIHEKNNKNRHSGNDKNSRNKVRRDQGVAGNSFKEGEVKNLMMAMLQAQAQGESVRSCANRLANNDPKLMLRYQNKYRNIIANKQEYVKSLMEEMDGKGIKYYDPYKKILANNDVVERSINNDRFEQSRHGQVDMRDSDYSGKELLEIVGQLIANMREIDGESLNYFFKGLRDLSSMAVQWKKREEHSAKILSYEARLEDQKKRITRLMSMFHQLMSVNRNFLNLSSAGKLSGLQDYTKELESLVKGYDAEIAD